ncbi:MAG: PAS domain S-box protein [Phycisphaerae bacterium]|nr:PAS domain S-box protein [Gemmatimonadaceae bacterium]
MIDSRPETYAALEQRLAESEATIHALLSGQIDAVVDPRNNSPVLLAQAQKALRDSEERYRGIVETSNEGIWMINFDSTITFVNQRLADMLGYSPAEIVGQSLYKFLPRAFHPVAASRLERTRAGASEENESVILQRNGQETWALVKTSCIRDANAAAVGMLAMITDWTRHREAERALRASEAEFRQIIESTSDGIIKVDRDGNIKFVNGQLAHMLGYEPFELVGASLRLIVAPSEWSGVIESIQGREQGAAGTFDTIYCHKSGAEISVNIAGSAVRDDQGQWIGVLGFVRDVTERKKLHAQLIVSDRMASVGTLAAGVAHEINNPLAAIIANLEYAAEGVTQLQSVDTPDQNGEWIRERIAEPLADAHEAAERVRFIVRDLMIFSRSPAGESSTTVDVNAALESSLRMGWNEIRHRAVLSKKLGDVPLVAGNEARLGQVFLNLIVNAAQSLPSGHLQQNEIHVSTYQEGAMVVIEIADTGAGIPPESIERIFDAFYTTKDVGTGTGLGLAICQRIITDMHGTLTVSSTVGAGSVFRVSVPVASQEHIPIAAESLPRSPNTGKCILIVDDEEAVGRAALRLLGDSYNVLVTTSAWAALALVETGQVYDMILCDLMMPTMTGMELHEALMAQAPDAARRLLFMTGGAFTPEAREFVARSGITCIEKPFDVALLRSSVHNFLAGLEPAA